MKKSLLVILILSLSLSCSTVPKLPELPELPELPKMVKMAPEHTGIDPALKSYYDEYLALAKINKLDFTNKITIGFKTIDEANVVGLCTRNGLMGFREIDVDKEYWNSASMQNRATLIFHELTHCLCSRGHDFGDFQFYPETDAFSKFFTTIKDLCVEKTEPKGFYDDGCPLSLMYPNIVPPDCLDLHYSDYMKELFDRCEPW